MKKLLLMLLEVLITLPVFALDFEYTYEGQTLKYSTTYNDGEVRVCAIDTSLSGNVVIPETVLYEGIEYKVTEIGNFGFTNCTGLSSIIIPKTITKINDGAFSDCHNLTSVTIPNSVKKISDGTFANCYNITSITIPDSVTSIGGWAFQACGMTSVSLPDSIITIGQCAFLKCSLLSSVIIPNSVTSIDNAAFDGCESLTSVKIPNSVTEIGDYAFIRCKSITTVYYEAEEPISGSEDIFRSEDNDIYQNATLYVPAVAVDKCKTIDPWKNFNKIEAYDFSGIEEVSHDLDTDVPYEIYDLKGLKTGNSIEGLTPGIYILRQGNAINKIAVK